MASITNVRSSRSLAEKLHSLSALSYRKQSPALLIDHSHMWLNAIANPEGGLKDDFIASACVPRDSLTPDVRVLEDIRDTLALKLARTVQLLLPYYASDGHNPHDFLFSCEREAVYPSGEYAAVPNDVLLLATLFYWNSTFTAEEDEEIRKRAGFRSGIHLYKTKAGKERKVQVYLIDQISAKDRNTGQYTIGWNKPDTQKAIWAIEDFIFEKSPKVGNLLPDVEKVAWL